MNFAYEDEGRDNPLVVGVLCAACWVTAVLVGLGIGFLIRLIRQ